jgi:aspartyl-tRNA(Asn)/glutamyl-tRNA(Gln) amidotransferase subunit B
MNSFRHVQSALEYEVRRQRDILLDGGQIVQETLLWNPDKNCSESMRGKEDAHDYRYFPCPDLVPIEISDQWIAQVRDTLPELPDQRKARFTRQYDLPEHDAVLLTADREVADYFEKTVKGGAQAKKVSNWIMTELLRELKGEEISSCKVAPPRLAALLLMVEKNTISGKIAKTVFLDMMASGKDPQTIVQEKNLLQVSDTGELLSLVREIIAAHPAQVEDFRAGKTKLMGFFVGQLMQKTKGKANPQLANELFSKELRG